MEPIKQKFNGSSSSKEHSKSLNDLRHLDNKTRKKPLATPTPIRKVESVSLPNGSTSLSPPKSLHLKTRPPYPLPEATSEPDIHEYEEPVESPTKTKTEEFPLEEPPPMPNSTPPFLLLKQNQYDDPVDNTFKLITSLNLSSNNSAIDTKIEPIKRPKDKLTNTREVLKTNSIYLDDLIDNKKTFKFLSSTADDYEEITPGEEYKETFPFSDKDLEPSTLILMTQPSMDLTPETPRTPNKTIEFSNGPSNEPEEEFKVNVVQYDYNRKYSMSDDELSMDGLDNEELKDYTPMGYTSQAASIFFGVELDPPTPKPRKVMLMSSTNDEEDC